MFKQVQIGYVFIIVLVAAHATVLPSLPRPLHRWESCKDRPPNQLIDMSKWDKGPDNRWAFQHISEIIYSESMIGTINQKYCSVS
ncbi:MAG: hypothetical protein ACYTFK_05520 [Planctomycetota bacterium]|jgi:hypothetical protein